MSVDRDVFVELCLRRLDRIGEKAIPRAVRFIRGFPRQSPPYNVKSLEQKIQPVSYRANRVDIVSAVGV